MNRIFPMVVIAVIATAALSWYISQGPKPVKVLSATERYLDSALLTCNKSVTAYLNCKFDLLCSENAVNKTQACRYLNFTAYICNNLVTMCTNPQKAIDACGRDAYCYHNIIKMIAGRDTKAAIAICNAEADVSLRNVCYTDVMSLSLKMGRLAESCGTITHPDYQNACWNTANRQ